MYARIVSLLMFTHIALATPWMTGPLLAPSGKTIPPGHFNIEPYGFYTVYPQDFKNIEVMPIISAGINDFMDLQTSLPIDYSWARGQRSGGIGDYSLGLGFQLIRQQENSRWPDARLIIQQVFPTGRFENLHPNKRGTDQTGSGSYQTSLALTLQRLSTLPNEHYLRTRLNLTVTLPSDVTVHGLSVFGGSVGTSGTVTPGDNYAADLAFEYSLSQHWVAVFETLYNNSSSSNFNGNPGFTPGASVGGPGGNNASLAPALEYNFNANVGLIGGVWFSVTGPHAAKFAAYTVAVNWFI